MQSSLQHSKGLRSIMKHQLFYVSNSALLGCGILLNNISEFYDLIRNHEFTIA